MKKLITLSILTSLLVGCGGEGFFVKKYSEEYARKNLVPAAPAKIYANAKEIAIEAFNRIEMISVSEYDQLLKSGAPHMLIDLREGSEVASGKYDNAIHIPRGVLEFKVANPEKWKSVVTSLPMPSKNDAIVVYCKSGMRSALATDNMQLMGFTNVKMIRGGWDQQKKGLEDEGSKPVKREIPPVKIIGKFKNGKELTASVKANCTPIAVTQIKDYLAATPNVYLFDVRQPKEYKAGHIDNAILVPRGASEFKFTIQKNWAKVKTTRPMPGKNDSIVLYCKKGSRSVLIADAMRKMGFTNVRYLDGGWIQFQKGTDVEPAVDDGGCG